AFPGSHKPRSFETSFRTRGPSHSEGCSGSCRAPDEMQMFGACLGIGDAKAASVLQRRHAIAGRLDLRGIDLGKGHAGLDAALGESFAPRGDDQRMAVGLALVLMHAGLCRGKHETAVLDGA